MHKLKRALATTSASLVLSLGAVGGASAAVTCTTTNSGVNGAQVQTCVDDSTNTTYTVSGNCSGIFQTTTNQNQSSSTNQTNVSSGGVGLVGGSNNSTNSNSSSTSQSQSGSNLTFAPDCSVTNVTKLAAAASKASATASSQADEEAQVVAPTGGVHAGGGAGAEASSTASLAGLAASIGSLGMGVALRKRALLGL